MPGSLERLGPARVVKRNEESTHHELRRAIRTKNGHYYVEQYSDNAVGITVQVSDKGPNKRARITSDVKLRSFLYFWGNGQRSGLFLSAGQRFIA
ncbi:hypothetical protein GWI33_013921 [Rhynchophorus ferrugineus]|uniref:Uncharacterized protein n=1 Tax=Rhynchophorus ferrugineus TaxID=354439 RepID=A0A834I3P4_RHYFE|nr:hypothetical protein GWI33_013921 [Rhynchophorus ferrugineus]